ncbi:hypothetical protein CRUP_002426 [Coryphaenoides rupestris]|nr:hypothetical protein CRUP_002426 [Coryphaenoides rupestris]
MTGPPVDVKLWGQRSLVASDIRRLEDLNEITSHMLEVVQAHMLPSARVGGTPVKPVAREHSPYGLSTIQSQVLDVINMCPRREGISFDAIKTALDYLSGSTIRRSLAYLLKLGSIFTTVDEQHFKSIENSD